MQPPKPARKPAAANDRKNVSAMSAALDTDDTPIEVETESLPEADLHFDTPPSKTPIGGQEEKNLGQIHSQRPNCPMCGQPMHANRTKQVRSTHTIYRFYYCKNDDCSNTRGQQVVINTEAKRIIDATDSHGRIEQINVAARSEMTDTEGA